MKLASFSVSDFRSITTAKKVSLTEYSVLVGANNEGKSNILHALAIGMEVLERFKYSVQRDRLGRIVRSSPSVSTGRSRYDWHQDYPISKQKKTTKASCSEIILEFQLTDDEVRLFANEVGSKLNGTLPIAIKLHKDSYEVSVPKPGQGGASLTKKANQVADFVSRRINFEYIPAIRTSESAEGVIADLVAKELLKLEGNEEYKNALAKIESIQAPILKSLSDTIKETVSSFLPSVKDVSVSLPREARNRAFRRSISIEIDDGNRTPLERKGDGVKSLVALALMRHASSASSDVDGAIVAIEEPEAHLHPSAIHELREVLVTLSQNNQVIITSHSPLFVNSQRLESTIVVKRNKAGPAKDIAEVREVLGVRLSDNLQSARLVVIVEGDSDTTILKAILKARYPKIWSSITSGDLVFDEMGGAANLSYKIRMYKSSACMIHCFLDGDNAGKVAIEKSKNENIINAADYNLFLVNGFLEAELEDLLDAKAYQTDFIKEFGVDPTIKPPAARAMKWSDAMAQKFLAHGKVWDKQQEIKAKIWLAQYASDNIDKLIMDSRFSVIKSFAETLERKMAD